MNIYPYFFKSRQKADGTYPVYIFVSRPPKRFCVNSGLTSTQIFEGMSFPKKEPNSRIKTTALVRYISEIEGLVLQNPGISDNALKEIIEERIFNKTSKAHTLCSYMREYADACNNKRTKEIYETTARKVEAFDKHAGFEIDIKWLERFVKSLEKEGLGTNAISIHLRNIRAVFNRALDHEKTVNYPFRKFKIRHAETQKRNISAEHIKRIKEMEVKPYQERYRDLFILSFLLIGVNPVDLLNAKPEQLNNGRFEYIRAKTHKAYSIKIEKEAKEIIDRYRGKEHLLKFCDNSGYKNIADRTNDFLRGVGKSISLYSARHSWATIASDLDIPIDTISACLGHSHGSEVTQIYINYDRKKIDEANRKVLDFVFGERKKEGE